MEARNRDITEWFSRIQSGQLRLPRFQRFEAWGYDKVAALLEAILRGLPAGSTLILDIGDKEPFVSRPMVGAPAPTNRPTEHLLDGQQRLTALWRSLSDNYEDCTFFVALEDDEETPSMKTPKVTSLRRWIKDGKRYPKWVDKPAEIHERGFIPVALLRPGEMSGQIEEWAAKATGEDMKAILAMIRQIGSLRQIIASTRIPFLSLPVTTPKDVALEVFINMNTSAVPLTAFDILVAQFEEETGQSLHALVSDLSAKVPAVAHYAEASDLILSTAALREDRAPTQANYSKLDLTQFGETWDQLRAGVDFAIRFLEEERIFDKDRLPTYMVLPVLAAIHPCVPAKLDGLGNAKALLRKYIWRAFFTDRYENSAASRSLQDLRGLRAVLQDGKPHETVPIFDEKQFSIVTKDELLRSRWPKSKDILARAILSVSLRAGGHDLADATPVSRDHLKKREYHHLFPEALLTGDGKLTSGDSYKALNCALITWTTNRNISAKEPVRYLRERVQGSELGEIEIRARLATHAIPFAELNVGGYDAIADIDARAKRIQDDYAKFAEARAGLVVDAANELCNGRNWPKHQ